MSGYLSILSHANSQLPGNYLVDVYINEIHVDFTYIDFQLTKSNHADSGNLSPCLKPKKLIQYGVKENAISDIEDNCFDISKLDSAFTTFDFNKQKLYISLPQIYLKNQINGFIPPEQWDNGIDAILLNYYIYGGKHFWKSNYSGDFLNANIRPGLNIGPWRFRYSANISLSDSKYENSAYSWRNQYAYVYRALPAISSELTLGKTYTSSSFYDSLPFIGVKIASSDAMLPDSVDGYAPTVRGIAKTQALLTIKQNRQVIYQRNIPAGGFEITDLSSANSNIDLDVTLIEADGSISTWTVPFNSLPGFQREGKFSYSINMGVYDAEYDSANTRKPFSQLFSSYGLNNLITLFSGAQVANGYYSLSLGAGLNLAYLGAISLDAAGVKNDSPYMKETYNTHWQAEYNKHFDITDSTLHAAYERVDRAYLGLPDFFRLRQYEGNLTSQRKDRSSVSISQKIMNNYGDIYLNVLQDNYWDESNSRKQFSAGYNDYLGIFSYGIRYTYSNNFNGLGNNESLLSFNLSVPISGLLDNTYGSLYIDKYNNNKTAVSLAMNGSFLENNTLDWRASAGRNSDNANAFSSGLTYHHPNASMGADYLYDNQGGSVNYNLEGAMLAHPDGLTLSHQLDETVALVDTNKISGIGLTNDRWIRSDAHGYALVPYLTPFRKNVLTLDLDNMPGYIDVTHSMRSAVPTKGAVVKVDFDIKEGYRALLTIKQENGKPIPFGAEAMVSDLADKTIIGDFGQLYLSGAKQQGHIHIHWGKGKHQSCQATYQIPHSHSKEGIFQQRLICKGNGHD